MSDISLYRISKHVRCFLITWHEKEQSLLTIFVFTH